MRKRRSIEVFSLSFLDLISGALGAVIILYVAIPKKTPDLKERSSDEAVTKMLEKQIEDLKGANKKLQEDLEKETAKALVSTVSEQIPVEESGETDDVEIGGLNADIGFKFQGKNIVFIIDTSYSMIEEDRMGQVKAGIKMLLTSLSSKFKVEVVQFPLGERAPFRSMWGMLKDFRGLNREDAFDFIYALRPLGGTPTRETLRFVLTNYTDVSDIVLLTDGAPTHHNSNRKDDIYSILSMVRGMNQGKIQINTIGVGRYFIKDKTSEQYKFLSLLASENKGFFVGF
jgi:Mg-chelatase subunit ChlD